MKKNDTFDVRDVDRQAEERKGNYLVYEDDGYRYAVHNICDESDWLYKDEWEARMALYDHLEAIWAKIDYLPSYDELKWKKIQLEK